MVKNNIITGVTVNREDWIFNCWSGRAVITDLIDKTTYFDFMKGNYIGNYPLREDSHYYRPQSKQVNEVIQEYGKTGRWPWEIYML